jgi:hypothetical protein
MRINFGDELGNRSNACPASCALCRYCRCSEEVVASGSVKLNSILIEKRVGSPACHARLGSSVVVCMP